MMQKFLNLFKESNSTFEGKAMDERVVLVLRKHRFTLYTRLTLSLFAFLIPVFIFLAFFSILKDGGYISTFLLIASLWYLFFWALLFYALMLYTLNVVIVTDRRIIDNDQYGLWSRKISELHISRIQDISVQVKGFVQTTFKFGDISVQTAGSEKQFIFHDIPHPERVNDTIMSLISTNSHGVRTV